MASPLKWFFCLYMILPKGHASSELWASHILKYINPCWNDTQSICYLGRDVQTAACIQFDTLLNRELESAMSCPFWWGALKKKCPGLKCMCFEEFFTQKSCQSGDDSSDDVSQLPISRWSLLVHVSASCWLVSSFELPWKASPPVVWEICAGFSCDLYVMQMERNIKNICKNGFHTSGDNCKG